MAGSPPNFHKMDSRSACIQDVLKVKVKGHVIRALLCWHENRFFSQANGRIAIKLAQCTRWSPGKPAPRVCSRSRSRSKVTWYAHFLGFLEWATPSLTVWFCLLLCKIWTLFCRSRPAERSSRTVISMVNSPAKIQKWVLCLFLVVVFIEDLIKTAYLNNHLNFGDVHFYYSHLLCLRFCWNL